MKIIYLLYYDKNICLFKLIYNDYSMTDKRGKEKLYKQHISLVLSYFP